MNVIGHWPETFSEIKSRKPEWRMLKGDSEEKNMGNILTDRMAVNMYQTESYQKRKYNYLNRGHRM